MDDFGTASKGLKHAFNETVKLFMFEERFEKLVVCNFADGTSVNMGCYSSKVVISNYFIKALRIFLSCRYHITVKTFALAFSLPWYSSSFPFHKYPSSNYVITTVVFMRVGILLACGRGKSWCILYIYHLSSFLIYSSNKYSSSDCYNSLQEIENQWQLFL